MSHEQLLKILLTWLLIFFKFIIKTHAVRFHSFFFLYPKKFYVMEKMLIRILPWSLYFENWHNNFNTMCVYYILTLYYAWLIRNSEHWPHEPRPVVGRLSDFWVWLRLHFQDLFYNSFSFALSPLFLHENDTYYFSVWKRILK